MSSFLGRLFYRSNLYIYIYIYRERERVRKREGGESDYRDITERMSPEVCKYFRSLNQDEFSSNKLFVKRKIKRILCQTCIIEQLTLDK